ncbi:hypothetical protein ABK040_015313 [Willaertia magna]
MIYKDNANVNDKCHRKFFNSSFSFKKFIFSQLIYFTILLVYFSSPISSSLFVPTIDHNNVKTFIDSLSYPPNEETSFLGRYITNNIKNTKEIVGTSDLIADMPPPRFSVYNIHKIIVARFGNSNNDFFQYIASKSHPTINFYFATIVSKNEFLNVECNTTLNSLDPSANALVSTLIIGKYNLEEERVVWASRTPLLNYIGKPFIYIMEKDEIVVTYNSEDDRGIFSKIFLKLEGETNSEPSFKVLSNSKENELVLEGTLERFKKGNDEGYILYGTSASKSLNTNFYSKVEQGLTYEETIISTYGSNGIANGWNMKLIYVNKEVFDLLSLKIIAPKESNYSIITCINFIGAANLRAISTDGLFIYQPYYLNGEHNIYRISTKYCAAGIFTIDEKGVLKELFSLHAYPINNSSLAKIHVKGFYFNYEEDSFTILAYISGIIGYCKGSNGFPVKCNHVTLGITQGYVIFKYKNGVDGVKGTIVDMIDENPLVFGNYYIGKRLDYDGEDKAIFRIETFDITKGTHIDSKSITIECENPYDLVFDLFYMPRRYLMLKGVSQTNTFLLVDGKYKISSPNPNVRNEMDNPALETVFMLYLNTHPPSDGYDEYCKSNLTICRANQTEEICSLRGYCTTDGNCNCQVWYGGVYCQHYYFYVFWIIFGITAGIIIFSTGSTSTIIGMVSINRIKKRLKRLREKEEAEKQLESKLLQYSGLQINNIDLKSWILPFEELVLSKQIVGEGIDGIIVKGKWKGIEVAVKKVKLQQKDDDEINLIEENNKLKDNLITINTKEGEKTFEIDKHLEREATILCRLRHPHILRFWGISFNDIDQFLITELLSSNLDRKIKECQKGKVYFPFIQKVNVLRNIANAMNYLHEFNPPIIHRDLKPSNILLYEEQKTTSKVITRIKAKVSDFGFSRHLQQDQNMTGNIGTLVYMDPILLKGELRYTEKCDVYSFSILMYELFFETQPYRSSSKVGEYQEVFNIYTTLPPKIVNDGFRPRIPFSIKTLENIADWMDNNLQLVNERIIDPKYLAKSIQTYIQLMKQCWNGNPNERPSFRVIEEALSQILNVEQNNN